MAIACQFQDRGKHRSAMERERRAERVGCERGIFCSMFVSPPIAKLNSSLND
jgi:hypothetical protein